MTYYAHTAEDEHGKPLPPESGQWQPLSTHLRNVAVLAEKLAAPMGSEAANEAGLAGLLHDLGKYSARFQARLRDPHIHGINHWAAGAVHAFLIGHRIMAFPIDGHHTGLPPARGSDGLEQTLKKFRDPKERATLTGCIEDLPILLERIAADGIALPVLPVRRETDHFAAALRARFLLSVLTDADFLDTENHFDTARAALRPGNCPLQETLAVEKVLAHLAAKASDTALGRLRGELLDACLARAESAPGLFTLTAPTGSGKTLASLVFALRHIAHNNRALAPDDPRRLRRLIVVIPYTSIIEQTARVFRDLFAADFGEDYVLEHHANVAPSTEPGGEGHDAEETRIRRARLAAENWSSPIIVTTNVRFFESLFAHKTSACRRLHAIARSVVLFDEVQTLPPTLAPSLLSATRILSRDYGCTTVFMTATQPAFVTVPLAVGLAWDPTEINPRPDVFASALRRTEIVVEPRDHPLDWPALAARLATHDQTLCVVNTTAHARELFRLLPAADRFHLSSRLCPAHRFAVLAEIRQRLNRAAPRPCRLVSTQLIEAGVDVDFPAVYRAFGPLDSIIQTAGRCNREGRQPGLGRVTVFHPADTAMPPGVYSLATAKTEEFLSRHPTAALDQPETYARYFEEFYRLAGPDSAERDAVLALSQAYDFPAASEKCRYIDADTRSVIVEWGEGSALIEKLHRERHLTANECRRAQRFSVNLYSHEFTKAQACGAVVQPVSDFDLWVWKGHYDPELGAVSATARDCIL